MFCSNHDDYSVVQCKGNDCIVTAYPTTFQNYIKGLSGDGYGGYKHDTPYKPNIEQLVDLFYNLKLIFYRTLIFNLIPAIISRLSFVDRSVVDQKTHIHGMQLIKPPCSIVRFPSHCEEVVVDCSLTLAAILLCCDRHTRVVSKIGGS